jgi:hypothetical protein
MQADRTPRRLCADMAVQRAVLAQALAVRPHWCTIIEMAREIDCGDAVERAVRDLVGIGLIECRGVSFRPTPAAAHFYRLDLP